LWLSYKTVCARYVGVDDNMWIYMIQLL
jgi:hypothetical protein